jgi:hypothetical protein
MNVAMGLTSRTQTVRGRATTSKTSLKELAREKELAEKYDVFIDGMAAKLDIPQPIPDPEQSGGSGMPDGGSGPTSSVKPKAKAKKPRAPARSTSTTTKQPKSHEEAETLFRDADGRRSHSADRRAARSRPERRATRKPVALERTSCRAL